MKNHKLNLIGFCLLAILMVLPVFVQAEDVYEVIIRKQEKKKQQRWTLADWFETKNTMRLQDMWLDLHSSTPFEFYLGGDSSAYTMSVDNGGTVTESTNRVTRGAFAAFVTMFGLEATYYDAGNDYFGYDSSFHLRLLGNSIQQSNFTIEYGQRYRAEAIAAAGEIFQNGMPGASLTLYLSKHFGISGKYKMIQSAKSDKDTDLEGTLTEASIFIDYGLVRIYGTMFDEQLTFTQTSAVVQKKTRTGIYGGLNIYF